MTIPENKSKRASYVSQTAIVTKKSKNSAKKSHCFLFQQHISTGLFRLSVSSTVELKQIK